jgi:hypothetical protein
MWEINPNHVSKGNGGLSLPLLEADFPRMNFTHMHERLRLELLRRIQRGTLSVSLLARQTGFGQSHMSNFLRSRRLLSLEALDRVLAAQHMTAAELLPVLQQRGSGQFEDEETMVPVVSHHAAMMEPYIRPSIVKSQLHLPHGLLASVRARVPVSRRAWQRFVAVHVSGTDAAAMEPLVLPDAIALLDRHYTSLIPYRENRPNLYAVPNGAHLTLRYAEFGANRLILRPHVLSFPVDMLEVEPDGSPSDLITGRVAHILNEA